MIFNLTQLGFAYQKGEPGYSSYAHMYPDTPEQAQARGMGKQSMRGHVVHPGRGWYR